MEDAKILGMIDDKRERSNDIRKVYEKDWYVNIAYVYGKQWIRYSTSNNRLFIPEARIGYTKFSSNFMLPMVRILTAKILKSKPVLIVVPNSKDKKDVEAARVGEKILQFLHRKLHLDIVYQDVVWGLLQTANYFIKPYWNSGENIISDPETTIEDTGEPYIKKNQEDKDEQVMDSAGNLLFHQIGEDGEIKEKTFGIGDVDIDIVSPFELQIDPLAKTIQEARYIIHEKVRSLGYVKDKYDKEVKSDDVASIGVVEQQLLNLLGQKKNDDEAGKKDTVIVKEYWEAPTKEFKKGRRIVVAGGEVLLYEESFPPEYKNKYPFVKFGYLSVFGRFWDATVLENIRPLQKEYNKVLSDIIEFKNKTQFGKTIIPTTCKISDNSFTDMPAEKIYYVPQGGKPEVLSYPPMNMESNVMLLQVYKQDANDIAGIHEVSHSKTPKGVRSGQAIAYLQEQDDTQLGPVIAKFEESIEELGNIMINIAREKYKEPRLITIVGQEGKDDIESFEITGDDIPDCEIICQMSSAFPQHRIAKQQMIMEYLKVGLIDLKEARKYLELGSEDLFKDDKRDLVLAKSENEELEKGNVTIAQEYNGHLVHLQEHDKFRNRDDYAKLPKSIRGMFEAHIKGHKDYLRMQANDIAAKMKQVQEMQEAGAGPGSKNKPAPKIPGGIPSGMQEAGIK